MTVVTPLLQCIWLYNRLYIKNSILLGIQVGFSRVFPPCIGLFPSHVLKGKVSWTGFRKRHFITFNVVFSSLQEFVFIAHPVSQNWIHISFWPRSFSLLPLDLNAPSIYGPVGPWPFFRLCQVCHWGMWLKKGVQNCSPIVISFSAVAAIVILFIVWP